MAQDDPPKEASTVQKGNDWLIPLSSNEIICYIKEWTTATDI